MLGYEISMLCSGFCRKDMLELTEDIDKWNQRTYEISVLQRQKLQVEHLLIYSGKQTSDTFPWNIYLNISTNL